MAALVNGASLVQEPVFHASAFMRRAAGKSSDYDLGPRHHGHGHPGPAAVRPGPRQHGQAQRLVPAASRSAAGVPGALRRRGQLRGLRPDRGRADRDRIGGPALAALPFVVGRPSELTRCGSSTSWTTSYRPGRSARSWSGRAVPDCMFSGYWGKPEASLAAFRNLWHHTGDLGKLDEQQRLTFVTGPRTRSAGGVRTFMLRAGAGDGPAPKVARPRPGRAAPLGEDDIKISLVLREGSRHRRGGAVRVLPRRAALLCGAALR